MWRHRFRDPGPCPICGAPHHSCTTFEPALSTTREAPAIRARQKVAEVKAALKADEFTTDTYKRPAGRRRRP
jgi:hypothetical protein